MSMIAEYRNRYTYNLSNSSNTLEGTFLDHSSQILYILDFFNTSRSGSAQKTAGISFQTFLCSLAISFLACFIQSTIFCLLRCKFKNIYQPNCYFTSDADKVPPLGDGFFSWVIPTVFSHLDSYRKMGLDAYFFLRYLRFLLILFFGLAFLNIPVLIPINFSSGYDHYSELEKELFRHEINSRSSFGLDRVSMSNIAPKFSSRLKIHLLFAIISIIWFHVLVVYELCQFIKIKNQYLSYAIKYEQDSKRKTLRNSKLFNTILLDNIPTKFLTIDGIKKFFMTAFEFEIKNVWFIFNYKDVKRYYEKLLNLADRIECLETQLVKDSLFSDRQETTLKLKLKTFISLIARWGNYRVKIIWKTVPIVYYLDPDDEIKKLSEDFLEAKYFHNVEKQKLKTRESSSIVDHKSNKVFIEFENPINAQVLNQVLISNQLNEFNRPLTLVNPNDVFWANLTVQNNLFIYLRIVIGNILNCFLILGWVIPVAFFGMVSQVHYLAVLIPPLSWLKHLPPFMTDVISNILSVSLLVWLTQLVPNFLRWTSHIKCITTGAESEIEVQQWHFTFLFIHVFLVVTISSGFSVIIEGLLNNPVSVTNILATNLPKCSNFFFSYMVIRGLGYFGNNLLQSSQLCLNIFIYPLIEFTPRRKFNRLTDSPKCQWGSIYPAISILGAIGLVYCIISPLILVFCCMAFALILISFKYSLRYQYDINNQSETYGQLYPKAIFQLYSGIYCSEICLIGMFALSRNQRGEADCVYHSFLMFLVLILTVIVESQMHKVFTRLLSQNVPLMTMVTQESDRETMKQADETIPAEGPSCDMGIDGKQHKNEPLDETFYQKCFKDQQIIIWIPQDELGISEREVMKLRKMGIEASNSRCRLKSNGDIDLYNCPPDMI